MHVTVDGANGRRAVVVRSLQHGELHAGRDAHTTRFLGPSQLEHFVPATVPGLVAVFVRSCQCPMCIGRLGEGGDQGRTIAEVVVAAAVDRPFRDVGQDFVAGRQHHGQWLAAVGGCPDPYRSADPRQPVQHRWGLLWGEDEDQVAVVLPSEGVGESLVHGWLICVPFGHDNESFVCFVGEPVRAARQRLARCEAGDGPRHGFGVRLCLGERRCSHTCVIGHDDVPCHTG
jgi:hypothetical protein